MAEILPDEGAERRRQVVLVPLVLAGPAPGLKEEQDGLPGAQRRGRAGGRQVTAREDCGRLAGMGGLWEGWLRPRWQDAEGHHDEWDVQHREPELHDALPAEVVVVARLLPRGIGGGGGAGRQAEKQTQNTSGKTRK